MITETYAVSGMTCSACSAHVERAVAKLDGVQSVGVNLMLGSMSVSHDDTVTPQQIIAAVSQAGYAAQAGGAARCAAAAQDIQSVRMAKRLLLSLVFLLPLFYLGMGHMLGLPLPYVPSAQPVLHGSLQLALCLPILFFNRSYFTVGFGRLFRGSPNMDSLVALGAAAGLIYSLIALFSAQGHDFYFESSGMILTIVTLGRTLEQRSRSKTTDTISSLLALSPESAVVRRGGAEHTIPVEEIRIGDIVILRSGAGVPVDGTVCAGSAAVDESVISGESLPAEKSVGARVTGGTVVLSGYLECTAERIGSDTTLAKIVSLMEEASASKAPISRLADRIAAVFVPVVIAIALVCALLWATVGGQSASFCLSVGIAVLVISCPCALGLATPVAIMVGTGKAAERGILFKSAAALEQLGHLDTIVLDKTGTITEGKMHVASLIPSPGVSERALLLAAASAETPSEHPLGRAMVEKATQCGICAQTVSNFRTVPGGGVTAVCDGRRIVGGNAALMAQQRIDISALAAQAQELAAQGQTALYFAEDGHLLGLAGIADRLKSDSAAAVAALRQSGLQVALLTGDNERTARAVAMQCGIETVYAQLLPQDKLSHIAALQKEGRLVGMVGDGVNDAPALVQADIGLAIGAGTDVAIGTADVVLMHSSLRDITAAIDLSRHVLRSIRQNLFWAFFYNAVGIPIAAGALYPALGITLNPMLAAACMSLSSICVVANALRLRAWKVNDPILHNEETQTKTEDCSMEKTVYIEGMMCMHCAAHVEKALNALGLHAAVTLEENCARVCGQATDEQIRTAIASAGYTVTDIR